MTPTEVIIWGATYIKSYRYHLETYNTKAASEEAAKESNLAVKYYKEQLAKRL